MLLKDKVAVITGAAGPRGLGFATAQLMAEHGAKVVVLDLAGADPAAAAAKIGAEHLGLVADVTNKAACDAAIGTALEKFGRVDILVNNAGITQPRKILEITEADYDAVLDVSLRGAFNMSQAVIPAMKEQQQGSIINISSLAAQQGGGIVGGPHYAAAKAGMLGLARAMARDLGADSIRVNSITPGLIDTDITKGKLDDSQKEGFRQVVPLGRLGAAKDIGGACVFLASDLSAYCTGITLDVNGGMLIH